ncbi:hypothetical protein CHCC15325_3087 [Bacillus licheniformis]|uniref:P-loop NTPase fold protein n=1 Tax=Bacillus licheniformis TaxID=1402 RepID=UPI0011A3BB6D|nr:P-loop NTPase fold protein [Bacillus licheniformis]TWL55419.1 hypothetical protein CHCC15325_3087 [Bacillus licheniformis]
MKADKIISVLADFNKSNYERILINGEWGIGKTKYIKDFTNRYSNTCYISLFGKKNINNIIQDIYFNLIESDNLGKIKKRLTEFADKLNNINFSFSGLSFTVPLLNNIYTTMYKELSQKDSYIIIFDDLERRHDELGIKEIFGLIDSLSNIDGIKTVLVAATEHFDHKSNDVYSEYKEKAIDRTYLIKEYSNDAPSEILGKKEWETLKNFVESLKFKNLRTFQKTKLFILEVINTLGEEVFNEKFTKEDIYKMCFATVVFNIEHKGEAILLDSKMRDLKEDSAKVDYMCEYILKNSLDNKMFKNIFLHIKDWFETGKILKEDIFNEIKLIKNFKHSPNYFFSSEKEVVDLINKSRNFITELTGTEELGEICSVIDIGFSWSEALSIDFGLDKEKILSLIKQNIINHVNVEKNFYENYNSLPLINSEKARDIVNSIKHVLEIEYYKKLTEQIKVYFTKRSFNKNCYLQTLMDSIFLIKDKSIQDIIKTILEDTNFFFSIPSGEITQDHWNWCHIINKLIINIEKHWGIEGYYEKFKEYVKKELNNEKDRILQHRLKILFDR